MADSFLSDAEIAFLRELSRLKSRFLVVGMAAAVMQGSDRGTEDLDLWFAHLSDPAIDAAARVAGGIFAWRASPPMISGPNLSGIDLVWRCHGLKDFESEYSKSIDEELFGVPVKILPLERVIASKEAANRPKDQAALPSLRATLAALRASKKSR